MVCRPPKAPKGYAVGPYTKDLNSEGPNAEEHTPKTQTPKVRTRKALKSLPYTECPNDEDPEEPNAKCTNLFRHTTVCCGSKRQNPNNKGWNTVGSYTKGPKIKGSKGSNP